MRSHARTGSLKAWEQSKPRSGCAASGAGTLLRRRGSLISPVHVQKKYRDYGAGATIADFIDGKIAADISGVETLADR